MAHIRQSEPNSGLGFQGRVLNIFYVVPSPLGSGLSMFFLVAFMAYRCEKRSSNLPGVQGYLAHKKLPPPRTLE